MANPFVHWITAQGYWAPWLFVALFIVSSFIMIWRLEALSARGFEGTVLGTLVMPYCSGMGNLIYAFVLGRNGGSGADVMTNNLVNNVTDMTLVLGLPTIIWGIRLLPVKSKAGKGDKSNKVEKGAKGKGASDTHRLNRLSLLLTLTAVLFFTGIVWALGRKGSLNENDSLVLIGLFLFWQCFHVIEVLKSNVRQGRLFGWTWPFDLVVLALCAYAMYVSIDWLVAWVPNCGVTFITRNPGWLSGWMMVLPNAVLAFYYGARGQPETVYASQVGDCHVSIPLCLGVYTLFHPMTMPSYYQMGMWILLISTVMHVFFVIAMGRLPRFFGVALVVAYAFFLKAGLLG